MVNLIKKSGRRFISCEEIFFRFSSEKVSAQPKKTFAGISLIRSSSENDRSHESRIGKLEPVDPKSREDAEKWDKFCQALENLGSGRKKSEIVP